MARICDLAQGVTPGGGCLDIYLVRGDVAKTLEAECLRPAIEADDVTTWTIKNVDKWLIYPYDKAGKEINFGKLDLNLSQERARSEIDKRIVRSIEFDIFDSRLTGETGSKFYLGAGAL